MLHETHYDMNVSGGPVILCLLVWLLFAIAMLGMVTSSRPVTRYSSLGGYRISIHQHSWRLIGFFPATL